MCHRIMSREIGCYTPTSLSFISKVQLKEEINPHPVKKMFKMDFSERSSSLEALSQEDRKFLAITESEIRHCEDGHYEMPLPLRVSVPTLLSNREVALCRLIQLKQRFQSDKKYKDDYTVFTEKVIRDGFAEKVPPMEAASSGKADPNHSEERRDWYIQHHGEYHPKKPSKIRVVSDCSAEFQNESLNKHLL